MDDHVTASSPAIIVHELTVRVRALHSLSLTQNQVEQRDTKLEQPSIIVNQLHVHSECVCVCVNVGD